MMFKSLTATLSAGVLFLGLALPTAAIASPTINVGVGMHTPRVNIVAHPVANTRRVWVAGYYRSGSHGRRVWVPGFYRTVRVSHVRAVRPVGHTNVRVAPRRH